MTVHERSTPRSAPPARATFDAGGLRYGQNIANLDVVARICGRLRQAAVGRGRRRISPRAFRDPPGRPPVLRDRAVVPRRDHNTTAANCATQQGVFNAGTSVCSFPGRAAPAGAQGFPGIPDSSRTDDEPPQLGRLCRARHRSVRGPDDHARRPLRAFLATSARPGTASSRRAGSSVDGLCRARLDLERLPRAVAAPAILHHHLDQLHRRRAGRHRDARGQQPGRPWRSARSRSSRRKSVNFSFGATANPLRGLTITADYYQIKIKDRIVLTENLGDRRHAATAAVQRRGQRAARRQRLPERRRGALLHQRPRHHAPRASTSSPPTAGAPAGFGNWNADRGLQLQQDQDRQAPRTRSGRSRPSRASSCSAGSRASASPTASRATRSCSAPTATSASSA